MVENTKGIERLSFPSGTLSAFGINLFLVYSLPSLLRKAQGHPLRTVSYLAFLYLRHFSIFYIIVYAEFIRDAENLKVTGF